MTGGTFASIPALSSLNFPFFIGSVNGIVAALVLYVIIEKAVEKKKN